MSKKSKSDKPTKATKLTKDILWMNILALDARIKVLEALEKAK